MSKNLLCLSLIITALIANAVAGELGAYYCRLNSGQGWESDFRAGPYADVAVRFDDPATQFIFWRASSYLPHWAVGDQRWYVDELLPRSGDGSTVMPDKFCQYSKVRIIETTPARVVVHWRYAPSFSNVEHAGHADEYYTKGG